MQSRRPTIRDGVSIPEYGTHADILSYWSIPPVLYCLLCVAFVGVSFTLFHLLVELGAIIIGIMAMLVSAISYRYHQNSFHAIVATGLGWSAILDLFHAASYAGSGMFPSDDPNLPTQLWVAARFLQAGSLLGAALLAGSRFPILKINLLIPLYTLLVAITLYYGVFPDAFVAGVGLTPFKINAEYLVIGIFMLSGIILVRRRHALLLATFERVLAAIMLMVLAEICFTLYIDVDDYINAIGHILKLFAYWFLFQALVQTTIENPFRAQEELNFRLRERVKELKSLRDISVITEAKSFTIEQVLNHTIRQLPEAFLYPGLAKVGIESKWGNFGDYEAISPDRKIERPLMVNDENAGRLIAGYPADAAITGEVFLEEEYGLIEMVGVHLENVLHIISDRVQIQRLSYLYKMLSGTNRAVAQSNTLHALLHNVFLTLSLGETFPLVLAVQANDNGDSLSLEFSKGTVNEEKDEQQFLKELATLVKECWASSMLEEGHLFRVISPLPATSFFRRLAKDRSSVQALGLLPVCSDEELFAFFIVATPSPDDLTGEYGALLEQMSRDFGYAASSFAEQSRRKQAERKALLNEKQFEAVFHYSPLPMMILDTDGEEIRLVNPACIHWLGTGSDEITSARSWIDQFIANPDDRETAFERWQETVLTVEKLGHARTLPQVDLITLENKRVIGRGHVARFDHEILVAWTDLTEIHESEQRFNTMIEQAAMPIWVHSNQNFLYGNPAFCSLLGVRQDDLSGRNITDFIGVVDDEQQLLDIVGTPNEEIGPTLIKLRTEQEGEVEFSVQISLIEWEGESACISVGENVKERLAAEREMRRSFKLLNDLSKQIPGVIYQYQLYPDGTSRFPFASERLQEIYEFSPGDVEQDAVKVFDRLHPDDRAAVEESIMKSAENLEDWQADFRVNLPNQGERWRSGFAHPERLEDGSTLWHGFIQDSTERKLIDEELNRRNRELKVITAGTLELAARMVEVRDPYTAGHEQQVAKIARAIGAELGLANEQLELLEWAGMVHDVGKIGIPAEILTKPSRLSTTEFEIIKGHAQAGYEIVKDSPLPELIAEIIWQHHERLDGSGYPRGLRADQILLEAKIIAVADVLESMASHRPYRPALGIEAALEELEEHKGSLYDTEVVDVVVKLIRNKELILDH